QVRAPRECSVLSLHDALPIFPPGTRAPCAAPRRGSATSPRTAPARAPPARPTSSRPPARPARPTPTRAPWISATAARTPARTRRSEEHTSELQSLAYLVCRLL